MDKKAKGFIDVDIDIYYLCQDMLIYDIQELPLSLLSVYLFCSTLCHQGSNPGWDGIFCCFIILVINISSQSLQG